MQENYLYFAESAVTTGNSGTGTGQTAMMVPMSSYLSCDPISTTTTEFKFRGVGGRDRTETVTLTHTANKNKDVIVAFSEIINSPSNGRMVIVADAEAIAAKKYAEYHLGFKGLVTGCAIS